MAYAMGASITLDGEKEFKRAISEINAGLRVTASQLQLVTAKYSDNATSVKALTERGIVLENQIFAQREKIEKLKEALANSATTYGEADKRTMKWQVSLNKAEAELIEMEKELQDNSEALKKATEDMEKYGLKEDEVAEQTKSFGDVLNNIINSLGIQLPAGAEKAIQALDAQKVSTMALIGATAGLISGFAKTTIETAQLADEILTLSSIAGMTTDTIQELNYAAELVDVSTDTMTGAMSRMIRSMDQAKDGGNEASEAFRKLGLRVTDSYGKLKDSEQMFYDVIDALGRVRNETERDALAMQIFGRSARELNPLIEAGSQRLRELGEEAQKMGYVMDTDTLESFGRLDDAMQRFDNQTQAFKNSIAMVMLPVLTELFELLNKIDPKIIATVAIIGSIAIVAVTVMKSIGSLITTFSAMNPAMLKTTAIIVGVTAALIALAAIIGVIVGKGEEMNKTIANIGTSVGNMTNVVNTAPNRVRYSYASGIDYVPSDRLALIHKGEAVIPAHENPYNPNATRARDGVTQNVYVTVQADDLQQMADVVRLFNRFRQTARQGV